jgi:hypothetical protein
MWHLAQVHLYAVALCLAAGTRLNEVAAVAAAQVSHLLHRLGLKTTPFTQVNDLQASACCCCNQAVFLIE